MLGGLRRNWNVVSRPPRLYRKDAYAVDGAFSPVHKMNFIELTTPIVAREND